MFDRRPSRVRREAFYRHLAQCLDAGLPVRRTLELAARDDAYALLRTAADTGDDWLPHLPAPPLERTLLTAGDRAGRLPHAARLLADDLEAQRVAWHAVLRHLAYPVLVLHLVPMALLTPRGLNDPAGYVIAVLGAWAILWIGTGVLATAIWRLRRHSWMGRKLEAIPGVSSILALGQLERFLTVVAWYDASGLPLKEGTARGLEAADAHAPRLELRKADALAQRNESADVVLSALTSLPATWHGELLTAAHVGGVEHSLARILPRMRTRRVDASRQLARIVGATLYVVAAVAVALSAVHFYVTTLGGLSLN